LLGLQFPELAVEGAVDIQKIMTKVRVLTLLLLISTRITLSLSKTWQGDSILNQALSEIGGKGLFTKELDVALLDKSVREKKAPDIKSKTNCLTALPRRSTTRSIFAYTP
jgi:porphobilinogen deaminase